MSSTSADAVNGEAERMRCKNIATAIYLDDEQNLKKFITKGTITENVKFYSCII